MTYSPAEYLALQRTARTKGAVGKSPVCYRWFMMHIAPEGEYGTLDVLDFGAGKDAAHTKELQDSGYFAKAHDLSDGEPDQFQQGVYDYVIASNVLNVQPDWNRVASTLDTIVRFMRCDGALIVNVPTSPRKPTGFNQVTLTSALLEHFREISTRKMGSTTILLCEDPIFP